MTMPGLLMTSGMMRWSMSMKVSTTSALTSGSVNELRAQVSRKLVSCVTRLAPDTLRNWPEVMQLDVERDRVQMATRSAEALLARLLREDPQLADIEVRRAGLAEAFTELTDTKREAP